MAGCTEDNGTWNFEFDGWGDTTGWEAYCPICRKFCVLGWVSDTRPDEKWEPSACSLADLNYDSENGKIEGYSRCRVNTTLDAIWIGFTDYDINPGGGLKVAVDGGSISIDGGSITTFVSAE